MVDLPAFLPNFSNSARVTFFWATIWKSEGQGGSAPAPRTLTPPEVSQSPSQCPQSPLVAWLPKPTTQVRKWRFRQRSRTYSRAITGI